MQQASSSTTEHSSALTHEQIRGMLDSGTVRFLERTLNALTPVEIARLIQSSPPPTRGILWKLIDKKNKGEVMEDLPLDIQSQFLEGMDTKDLVELTEGLDADDIADILQNLPEQLTTEVLNAMSANDRDRVAQVIDYDEDTAGGLTDPDIVTVRSKITLEVVLRYLRRHDHLPASTDMLFVVNRQGRYQGVLSLADILTGDPHKSVKKTMNAEFKAIPASMPETEVAKLFEQHDWISAPVVDQDGKLIGRITIDDVVDVIRENADHNLMSMAGLDEEQETFAPIARTVPRRAVWLGINLLTAVLASSVINVFQDTLDKVVALAVLMPIVASMGGVAGSQTLTVVIRGMSLGQIDRGNIPWLLSREFWIGLINGLLWALALALVAAAWFGDPYIAMILACAIIINLIVAALAGALLPVILQRCKIDPALAGGVTLTTVTDVVGYLAFLGLASYFYL